MHGISLENSGEFLSVKRVLLKLKGKYTKPAPKIHVVYQRNLDHEGRGYATLRARENEAADGCLELHLAIKECPIS
jgi:hypothetical protein